MFFRKLRYQKILRGRREREFRDFPTKLFCLIAEKLPSGTVYCVKLSKKIFLLGLGHEFLWKIFCLTVPEFFVVEPF